MLEGCIEEGSTTAGRVENGQLQQPLAILLQLVQQALLGLQLAALLRVVFLLDDVQFFFLFRAQTPYSVLYDILGDVLRCIEHAVLLALGGLRSLTVGNLLRHFLNLAERVFEDVSEYIHVNITFKVVG